MAINFPYYFLSSTMPFWYLFTFDSSVTEFLQKGEDLYSLLVLHRAINVLSVLSIHYHTVQKWTGEKGQIGVCACARPWVGGITVNCSEQNGFCISAPKNILIVKCKLLIICNIFSLFGVSLSTDKVDVHCKITNYNTLHFRLTRIGGTGPLSG